MSHSSSASTGHTTRRMPWGKRNGGRLVMGEKESRSRGCMLGASIPVADLNARSLILAIFAIARLHAVTASSLPSVTASRHATARVSRLVSRRSADGYPHERHATARVSRLVSRRSAAAGCRMRASPAYREAPLGAGGVPGAELVPVPCPTVLDPAPVALGPEAVEVELLLMA